VKILSEGAWYAADTFAHRVFSFFSDILAPPWQSAHQSLAVSASLPPHENCPSMHKRK
jgi:hypothetical protein